MLTVLTFLVSFSILIVFLSKDIVENQIFDDKLELTEEQESEVEVDQLASLS